MESSPAEPMAPVSGTVREWHPEEGWGVIDSPETPGGCWAHFSRLDLPGYKESVAGQQVTFTFEPADQDGYSYRALHIWPEGPEPPGWPQHSEGPSGAFRSHLDITLDEQ